MAGFLGRNLNTGVNQNAGIYPATYQQQMNGYQPQQGYGWPGMQPGQVPQPVQPMPQAMNTPQLTRPTVHADIVQIETEAAGETEPVDAGTSRMMITKDEKTILIKSVLANGETTMDIYRKQPPAQKPPETEYVTRAEFERRMNEMIRAEQAQIYEPAPEPVRAPLRVLKPEQAEEPEYESEPEYETPAPRPVQRTRSTTGGKRK